MNDFFFHAQQFNKVWDMITSYELIGPGRDYGSDLLGDRYPKHLDRLLKEEIAGH